MPERSKRHASEFKRKAVELCKSKGDDMRSRRQGARVRPGVALRLGQDRGRLRMRARRQPVPDGRGPQASEARERDTFNSERLLRQPSAAAATPKEAKFAFVLMFKGSWPVSEMREAELADDALRTAIARHRPVEGCVHHSDHGAQYVSVLLSKTMRGNGIKLSTGAARSPWDNAATESPMGTVKSEGAHAGACDSREQAELDLFERIGCACNRARAHSAPGYVSPADFEKANWPEEEKSRPMAE